MVKKHFKKMTQSNFNQLKTLLNAGIETGKVREVTGRSWGVVAWVRQANSFEDYCRMVKAHGDKYKEKKNGELKQQSTAEKTEVTDTSVNGLLQSILSEVRELNKRLSERKIIW